MPSTTGIRKRDVVRPSLEVGGVRATLAQVEQAADALEAWPSTTIKPVLAPLGNPLADCDYHAVAAPFKSQFPRRPGRRGASGSPATKLAFIAALRQIAADARANPAKMFSGVVAEALAAFGRDESYAAEIARAAVAAGQAKHTAALRAQLRSATHQAVSECDTHTGEFTCTAATACGTGECRFAQGILASLGTPAVPGKQPRPRNHDQAGAGFDPAGSLAELEREQPYTIGLRVRSSDHASAQDGVK